MATPAAAQQSAGKASSPGQGFNYIEEMVSKPTWKEILLELIDTNRIDPWNIDIVEISNAFLLKVKEMGRMDFGVQANVILAAAILLRYKSDYLGMLRQSDMTDYVAEEGGLEPGPMDGLPELVLSSRIPPKRQITLDELVSEMERIIKYDSMERTAKAPRGAISGIVDLELRGQDIEVKMAAVMERVRQNTDSEGWSLFSSIVGSDDNVELVYTLLSLLHLAQSEKVDLRQDKLFGEIFIRLIECKKEVAAADAAPP